MDIIKKIMATVCAVLFVVSALLALFAFNFDRYAFSARIYQEVFANEDFYNRLPSVMAEAVMSANPASLPIVMQGMTDQAWEAFFRTLLPPDTLQTMGNEALTSTFEYINMQTDSAQLSLTPLKANMTGDTGVQAAFALLNTQPDCTLAQIGQMTLNLLSNGQMQFCKPPPQLEPLLAPVIQTEMQATALAIPDQVTLISAPTQNDPRQRLKTVRLLMRLSPILPLGFLFLLSTFGINSLKNWLNWWGIPFFITGACATVMGLSGAPVLGIIVRNFLEQRIAVFLPTVMANFAGELASAMMQALLKPVLIQGMILTVIGLIMVMVALFIKGKARPA